MKPPFPVGSADSQLWVQSVTRSRMAVRALAATGDPVAGSPLAADDAVFPSEYLSDATRGFLDAALDHLTLWSNTVAPMVFVDGSTVANPPRPYFALARAAIESASQAAWVLEPEASTVRVQRHVRLLLGNLEEMRKTAVKTPGADLQEVDNRIEHIRRCAGGTVQRAPNYLDMVRAVAQFGGLTPDEAEIQWRTASAGAHGKAWFIEATHELTLGAEYAPGRFRAVRRPEPGTVSATVRFASALALRTVLRYISLAGHDYAAIGDATLRAVAADLPRSVADHPTLRPCEAIDRPDRDPSGR